MELEQVVDFEVTHEVSIYEPSNFSLSKSDPDDDYAHPNSQDKGEVGNAMEHFCQISLRRDGCRPLKETACLLVKLEQIVRNQNLQKAGLLSINLYLSSGSRFIVSLSLKSCGILDSMDIYRAQYAHTFECLKTLIDDAMSELGDEEVSRIKGAIRQFYITSI